jgi:hypothetical protein
MTYEANFSFPPTAMFGRGVVIEGARSSSQVESMSYSQRFIGSGPASPVSPPIPQNNLQDISNQEWSDASDGGEKKTRRMNWTEEKNLKLVSAWLHHYVDLVKKKIVEESNSYVTLERRRALHNAKPITARQTSSWSISMNARSECIMHMVAVNLMTRSWQKPMQFTNQKKKSESIHSRVLVESSKGSTKMSKEK